MIRSLAIGLVVATTVACNRPAAVEPPAQTESAPTAELEEAAPAHFPLVDARAAVDTTFRRPANTELPPTPPANVFELTTYSAPLGENRAYVTPVVEGERRPAILWISGGFHWVLYDGMWEAGAAENDQSAAQLLDAGVVVMRAALRGQSGNPGTPECFLGEVDDVLAAADYLASRPDVDPDRVYIGGHSTGGVLALLATASTERFAGTFALGPVADPSTYGANCPPQTLDAEELRVRAPIHWVGDITTPTWILEGSNGNATDITLFAEAGSDAVLAEDVTNLGHFDIVQPAVRLLASQLATVAPEDIRWDAAAVAEAAGQ